MKKEAPKRQIFCTIKELIALARSYGLYAGTSMKKDEIHKLLAKNNLVDIIDGYAVEKEKPTPSPLSQIINQSLNLSVIKIFWAK